MKEFRGRVSSGGRIVIPAALRREYGLAEGREVVFWRGETGLELLSPSQALKRAEDRTSNTFPAPAGRVGSRNA
jgi:AbrB family looped-hinge helix DNA binding protein